MGIGSLMIKKANLLIASNPTFGLGFTVGEEPHRCIVDARNAGAAVLLISEDLDELLALVDRVGVMRGGRIVYEVMTQRTQRSGSLVRTWPVLEPPERSPPPSSYLSKPHSAWIRMPHLGQESGRTPRKCHRLYPNHEA